MAKVFTCTLKQGDLGPSIRGRITNNTDKQTPDLTGATVTFKLLKLNSGTGLYDEIFEKAAVIEVPTLTSGTVRYDWVAGDTDVIGQFQGLFKVVFASGDPEHYPTHGYIWIAVESAGPNP